MAAEEYKELSNRLERIEKLLLVSSKEVLTIEECALLTNYSMKHIYRMTSNREIPFYKPQGGKIYFRRSEIENWLLQGRQATNAEIERAAAVHCALHPLKRNKQSTTKK